jgi:hypothetical protein
MPWWWQDIHTDNVYPIYSALSQILNKAGWQNGTWTPIVFAGSRNAPFDLSAPIDAGEPFTASLALASYRRQPLSGTVAVANPLSAERASEAISAYLHGSNNAALQRPIKLTAFFANQGKLVLRVNAVAADAELIVQVDGTEASRTRFFDRDGQATANHEIDKELSVSVAPGKHTIQIVNTGLDWIYFDSVRLDNVQPAAFVDNWQWLPEGVGLRNATTKKAVVYVYSPYVAYPAGATRYHPPVLEQQSLSLRDWPDGKYTAQWFDPQTGAEVAKTEGSTREGILTLPIPSLADDLAGVIMPAN